MTPLQLAEALDLKIISRGDGDERTVDGVFCLLQSSLPTFELGFAIHTLLQP